MLVAILVLLFLLAVFGLPFWPYATAWDVGYWPSGLLFVLFLVVLIVVLTQGGFPRRGDPLV
jgi:hypothetical protein